MEWRQQTNVSCADAFNEAQRWIEEVTEKSFGCNDFRAALENGVLLCDLINKLKPGIIKRVNRLSTPIAGLDNVNVFLKACGKLGLNVSQLFHPGDLQDLSTRATLRRDETNRRLRNVLITIYWLGRKAHLDTFYSGSQLNFKAFEGLLGLALSKALDDGSNMFVKESWYPERGMRPSYKMQYCVDSIDSLDSQVLRQNSEGWGSDAEAEQVFKMEITQPVTQQNKGYIPPPFLQRKQGPEKNGRGRSSPLARAYQIQVRPERPVQVNPGWIWSKSLSDIPMVYPVRKVPDGFTIYDADQDTEMARECYQENERMCSVVAKDSEAQWQDDLSKWKTRRRSTKSDLRRKSQDREHVITQMANGAAIKFEKKEAQGEPLKRDQQSPHWHYPAPRPYSTPPHSKSISDLGPHTRALLARGCATETPFSPTAPLSSRNSTHAQRSSVGAMPASDGNILGEEIHFASLASHGAAVATPPPDYPFSYQTQVKVHGSPVLFQPTSEVAQPENVFTNQISTLIKTIQPNVPTNSTDTRYPTVSMSGPKELTFCVDPKVPTFCPDAVYRAGVDALVDLPHQNIKSKEKSQKISWEPAVQLGRGQQAVGVYKYLSRAGSWSGSASLPRGYRRSEGSSRLSSAITARPFGTKQSRVSSLPRLCKVENNQSLQLESEKVESISPTTKSSLKRQTATTYLKVQHHASIRPKKAIEAKQNGTEQGEEVKGATLSSQTSFQTNGYHHQTYTQTQLVPQPYSNLQTQHDKSSTLRSNASIDLPKVDHSDMRVSLTLKPNSRPDFGFQTHWDSKGTRVKFIQPGSPAELCQLCVDDAIVAVNGVAVAHLNYNQWKDKMTSSLQTGILTMDIRRYGNKDWSTGEGGSHNQPGQSRMTLNLTASAPVLIGCPDHHANSSASTETAVRKVSKRNGQTDDVLQGKVMHGEFADSHRTARSKDCNKISRENQKRRTEFFTQKGGSESAISDLQVPSLSPSSSSWSWNHEEDRRRQEKWQEEQERLLQAQYQRDQERLESEWRRAQLDAKGELCRKSGNSFEMTKSVEIPASTQLHASGSTNKTREEQRPDREELKETGSKPKSNAQRERRDKISGQAWAQDSFGFAQLSASHRAKSLSTPALAGSHTQTRGDERKRKGQSVSNAEKDRQQILEEMKKRTHLLTDNSWIRQRSNSFYKEPIYVGVPMKRYESLDDLDTLRQSTTTFGYPRPHSAAPGFCAPSRNSSSRYSTGSMLPQRNTFDSSHLRRMVSGRRTCCVCERVLGSGAAIVIEALSLCFHLACFQCVGCHQHLGGTETGVQVRIRNRKPHCEPCYFQLKSGGAPPM
ncbi:LIM domain only protein 7b isoform X2 [Cottoperca gobio]|uniref:LIM domain only protein 7b isoform X2 n=1 Tax=Cottoperca gobio TaxID=56716 RepID=A0A6J2PG61_COTGO|nr:LIM domain only protein 7-like isoform X2 [Cottoperca gobio]